MSTIVKLTLDQYDRMIAGEVFDPAEFRRIELINGELREMSPIGPPHEEVVDLLSERCILAVPRSKVRIRVQNSIGLPRLNSGPQVDIAWVIRKSYADKRPEPEDVLLVIEVADSSLTFDRGEKCELCARADIADYWIVNIPDRCVEVYRDPRNGHYKNLRTFCAGEELSVLTVQGVSLSVDELFQGFDI